jgi:imidazolonepropionase-like amidohydrolase
LLCGTFAGSIVSIMQKWFCALLALGLVGESSAAEILPPGHRPVPPGVHAFTGARLVIKPGEVLEEGTLVIREGFIAAAGKDVTPPADARVWNMKGLTIYPGLIDPFLTMAGSNPPVSTARSEPIDDRALTSGAGLNFFGVPGEEADPGGRGPGYQLPTIVPQRRVAETYTPNGRILEQMHELGFTAANIVPESGIVRGQSALVALSPMNPNESLIKADVFQHVAFSSDDREGGYPRSLMGAIAAIRQVMLDADHYAKDHEHYRKQPQGRKRPAFNPALEALGSTLKREHQQPVTVEGGSVLMSYRATQLGTELVLNRIVLASGHEWRRPDLFQGNRDPFIVPINFPELPKLPEEEDWHQVSLDQLRAWDWGPSNPSLLRKQGREVALTTYGLGDKKQFRRKLRLVVDRGLTEDDALAALTTIPARLCGVEKQLGTLEVGKIANLTIVEGTNYFQPDARVREVWIDGRMYSNKPVIEREKPETAEKKAAATNRVDTLKTDPKSRLIRSERLARGPLEGRGPLADPGLVLVRGATIWTCGPQGVISNGWMLFQGGRIKELGRGMGWQDVHVVNAKGKHVTPGLIDAHNHSMILGSVNEGSIPSSAMVRIADVVNSETAHIHRQLAGGLTTANLLHGSANPIGGQNCIIKLRDGASPDELKFAEAPLGIKFALGENVKQSSSDRSTRFPRSRMGVGTFIANRFAAAQQYLNGTEDGRPIRRDLELETLAEILKGKRWIHCHSYRQDEILAFLRLMESLNVKVGTLQHVLEGYKIADEIAQHGAGASCFADWWAYKYEVIDAIPYAGSLMRERGVLVSFNSDSSDHARRLNFEAAKAVKYGGTTEEEALKFVTINPAKQLRVDHRIGSLEVGKDADFVVWSASPLDSKAVCLQTWIDGKKYFDREENVARVAALEKERDELIEKAKQILKGPGKSGASDEKAEATFFQVVLEHQHDAHDRHCLDEED